uniref:Secreted protein n=1 Tax=Romanomermis culicivorax TaxID=13658 RepID=A0A915KUP8_ROMCU
MYITLNCFLIYLDENSSCALMIIIFALEVLGVAGPVEYADDILWRKDDQNEHSYLLFQQHYYSIIFPRFAKNRGQAIH